VQRRQSQAASQFGVDLSTGVKIDGTTDFLGYEGVADVGRVVALLKGGLAVSLGTAVLGRWGVLAFAPPLVVGGLVLLFWPAA